MNKILTVEKLSVSFWTKQILNNISFEINKGDIVSLIGKNWSWKSTLIKTITWIEKKYTWKINKKYSRIWYVPQKLTFDTTIPLTVSEFFEIYHQGHKHDIHKYLDIFKASDLLEKQIAKLSGGELQKILITNSLLCHPEFLILDEPTAWIDTIWEEIFYGLIHKVREKFPDIAILMVSHNMKMVYAHSNKVICLHQNCYCTGTPDEINNNSEFENIFWDYVIPYKHTHDHKHTH